MEACGKQVSAIPGPEETLAQCQRSLNLVGMLERVAIFFSFFSVCCFRFDGLLLPPFADQSDPKSDNRVPTVATIKQQQRIERQKTLFDPC
eukprot:m.264714 g.264714  ORF g.264714 m.264714 type:complete len:91 (-) comp58511_c0_seq1:194-466(-)